MKSPATILACNLRSRTFLRIRRSTTNAATTRWWLGLEDWAATVSFEKNLGIGHWIIDIY